ncbi:hypothetical protein WG66_012775 [Moniliophthora roreri]|uniref:P-loop containing nucleoside triphosphate hydrolase protein n=1 Tax=Moniliophthora roreri TaxID=221103 RepID=A0A0W0G4X0_MONRR|nr:hypothetical protein WG66_012775 [Moniliophthora roreri]
MTSYLSSMDYSRRRKELLALVNQLRAVGAQSELDLPRITIIGNQSAGKSSVVEAISGINLPRDAGTCTRCPIECRLTSASGPWRCNIKIRKEYDSRGRRLDEIREVPFGSTILDKADVEPALRRAQFAVLNAQIDKETILTTSLDKLEELAATGKSLSFSRNVVCVDLEGPELTDLSFIDLPGIIQNAPDDKTISLVEELALFHTKGNCLILVAIPMTDDIENQKALRLARQVDPEGERTIGVMTKPDMIGPGSKKALDLWLEVIEGRRHPLLHGYYCTRQPDDEQRNKQISSAEARSLEGSFFRNTPPWATSLHTQRFGTANLTSALSRLLIDIINRSLPDIKKEAAKQLTSCRGDLSSLPELIEEEPVTYILNEVIAFCVEFDQFIKGGSGERAQLIQDHRRAYEVLKRKVRRTVPRFVPFTKDEDNFMADDPLDGEEEAEGNTSSEELGSLNLTDMRRHIKKSITRELPNNVPFEAKVALINDFQQTWRTASIDECFERVMVSTVGLLTDLVNRRFERHSLLRNDVHELMLKLVEKHYGRCLMFLEAALEAEETPFTQNTHYLQTTTDKWLSKYKSLRAERNQSTAVPKPSSDANARSDTTSTQNGASTKPYSQEQSPASNMFSQPAKMPTSTSTNANEAFSSAWKSFSQPSPFQTPKPSAGGFTAPTSYTTIFPNSSTYFSQQPSSQNGQTPSTASFAFKPAPQPASSQAEPVSAKPSAAPQAQEPKPEAVNELLSLLAKCGYTGVTVEDLGKLKPADEYETELQVMAEVRGYFQVAYKRIIDNVPNFIDLRFLKALGKDMQRFLITELGLGTASANEKCAQYLVEDPLMVARRAELKARVKRLESVQRELNNLRL